VRNGRVFGVHGHLELSVDDALFLGALNQLWYQEIVQRMFTVLPMLDVGVEGKERWGGDNGREKETLHSTQYLPFESIRMCSRCGNWRGNCCNTYNNTASAANLLSKAHSDPVYVRAWKGSKMQEKYSTSIGEETLWY